MIPELTIARALRSRSGVGVCAPRFNSLALDVWAHVFLGATIASLPR